ncbi:MAG: hypothetical protein JSV66_12045 [Trueperaceae bacterium]|nr:MAG: hypothetical protein JSV66_12045 [Trueperaceae bacterium]
MNRNNIFRSSRRRGLRASWIVGALSLLLLGLVSGAQQERLWLYGGGTFAPGEEVWVSHYLPAGWKARLELFRVENPEKVLELGGPEDLTGIGELDLTRVRRIEIENDREWPYGDTQLGSLPLGLYYLSLASESQADSSGTLILVTDLGLVVKADEDTLLTYTAQLESGQPRKTRVFLLRGERLYAEGLATDDGLTEFEVDPGAAFELVVAAKYGDAWTFSDAYWNRWAVERIRLYLHTDRPVYRPGHTVNFKGTARTVSGLQPLSGETVQVVVRAADGSEILQASYLTDAYGSFAGELILGDEPPLGRYSVESTLRGETSYGGFFVEEFQKPEYRVEVVADEAVAVQGDVARFTVSAEYLFGGAVTGGNVNYAVLKQPHYRWRYRSRFGFYQEEDYTSYYGGEMIERGEGILDADGKLVIELELPRDELDYQLTLQAGVSDESRREIQGSGRLIAFRSEVVLGVSTERYANRVGEAVSVTVRAEDIYGRPVSVPFSLSAERSFWIRGEGRRAEPAGSWQGQTDAEGVATLDIVLDQQGSFELSARALDPEGREARGDSFVWVTDGSRWVWAYEGLNVTTDKPEYQLGETARFVIESPVPDAHLLINLEGDGISQADVVELDGSVLTYELAITEEMQPNGYLSVALIGGGETYLQTAGFRSPPVDDFLNLEITSDADTYRPRDKGTFALRVSDASGEGVKAQLALGLVDEAIYLVRPEQVPDIRGFFYAFKENLVGTTISAWYRFGQLEGLGGVEGREAMDEAVFAQGKADFAPAEVRQDFRDTILWLPLIETDEEGLATVEVTFPDNLTEWRLTARAITLDDDVGQNTYAVTTTLPVIARLAAPRFFIRGDEASLRVIGQNTLPEDQPGRLELSSDGLTIGNPEPRAVTLPAGGRASADFTVRAPTTGSQQVTATALTPAASDAMRLPIPVLPRGVREETGWAGVGGGSWSFDLPTTLDPPSSGGTLYLTPSLAAAVSPALSYLAGYPYGCTEQTMSRFLPSVLAAEAGELAMLPDEVAGELDDMVQRGLKRLYDFQHDDGGWGFWQYDESDLFVSAYVINGLLEAKNAGYAVREGVLERGASYLEAAVAEEAPRGGYRVVGEDAKAYAYYALARAGRSVDGIYRLTRLARQSPYGLALSSLAFDELGRRVEARLYLDALLARVTETDRAAFWEPEVPRYYWNDDAVEATAFGLEALVRLAPDHPLIPKIVSWLLLQRRGSRWVSTKDTAAVVKAALKLAEQTGEETFDYGVRVRLNGQVLEERRIEGQETGSFVVPLNDLLPRTNQLEVAVEGEGTLYASASVHYVAEDTAVELQRGLTVERTFEALTPVFDPDEQRYLYQRSPLGETSTVGEYVLVTVEITPEDDYRYVLVNEPLPAGYRVIENDLAFRIAGLTPRFGYDYYGWNYWYDGRDVRDERVDYYFSSLTQPVTFTYLLRAETPGTFTSLPTQAWLMYQPEVRGLGAERLLMVVEEGAFAGR